VSLVILRACAPGRGTTQDQRKGGPAQSARQNARQGRWRGKGLPASGFGCRGCAGTCRERTSLCEWLSHRLTARAGSTSTARSQCRREWWCEAESGGTGSGEVVACGLSTRAGVHDGGTETGSCRKTAARRPGKGRCKKKEESCAALICAKHRTRGGHATVRLLKMHPSH
jgi:hypothetical protein